VLHRRSLVMTTALLLVGLVPVPALAAGDAAPATAGTADDMVSGHIDEKRMRHLPDPDRAPASAFAADDPAPPTPPAGVGDERTWAALDLAKNSDHPKDYTLRGIGEHIEVWVASDEDDVSSGIRFPGDDCRNDERVVITDDQVNHLINEYDANMLPVLSEAFSTAPPRDGSGATVTGRYEVPPDYYRGEGDNVVVLVDNIRDPNFYDTNLAANTATYTAGFFYSVFNRYFDRNVMTIDAYDWLHRTGANPPDEPIPGDLCRSKPARPFSYESTFAHEYQHLLEAYEDADETSWVNEGLSMYAEQITGYASPDVPVTETGFDSYIQCLLGNSRTQTPANPNPRDGGAENSLTWWGDQGEGSEILCDYGAGFAFMLYLEARYGQAFVSALHRDDRPGLDSLGALLRERGSVDTVPVVLHRFQAMLAVDAALEHRRSSFRGDRAAYSVPALHAAVNWANPNSYQTPGAPPNGADYVRLRGRDGRFLSTAGLRTLDFDGASALAPEPLGWTVATDPPDHAGDPALFSGAAPNLDRAAIGTVAVPTADPSLTFETRWDTEPGWDFAVVQVSTDDGETWTSLANEATTTDHEAGADAAIVTHLPGFTGDGKAWTTQRFDLSRWAGQTVLVSFRMLTDGGFQGEGWWIDDIAIGGRALSDGSTTEGWRSATQVRPVAVAGFTVQLVGYPSGGRGSVFVLPITLDADFDARVRVPSLWRRYGADVVAVLVSYDEPTEAVRQYAPYTLRANGVVQPGGS
jgi:hypothetical protein